jgi:two-component system, cell cycle sensor histidine kinase and response regulator CckA
MSSPRVTPLDALLRASLEDLRLQRALFEETGRIAKVGGWTLDMATGQGEWTDELARIHDLDSAKGITLESALNFYTEESRPIIAAAFQGAVERAESYDVELEIISAKGVRKWVRTIGHPIVKDGVVVGLRGTLQDISDRKRADQSLRESEGRFRTLIDGAPEGIFVQSDGRFIFVNPAMVKLLGATSAGDLIGTESLDRVAPELRDAVRERIRMQLETGQPAPPMEVDYLRLDGTRVPIESTAVPTSFRGRRATMVFVRDITTRRLAEADREHLREQLLQSQKMESVGQLAGGVAHDFNNILTVQKGYLDMLRRGLRAEDPLAQGLAAIDDCTERAATLTRQLLAFSRRQALQPKVLDLNTLVGDLSTMLRRIIGEDVVFTVVRSLGPARVKADPGQLEQVLVNLAVNARDAMPSGGHLTIEVRPVELDAAFADAHVGVKAGRHARITLSDTGCGMSDDIQARVFEPFFTTKPVGKGTGLGLAMVHGIVLQSGGTIWVDSRVGVGTTFTVYLPQVDESEDDRTRRETAAAAGAGEQVLVVEDEPALLRLVILSLSSLGYRVTGAQNGTGAVLMIEEQGLRPDVVLADVVMPGMNGQELMKRVRRTIPGARVVFMSGYADRGLDACAALGPGAWFLQKPFSIPVLTAKIREALAARPPGA